MNSAVPSLRVAHVSLRHVSFRLEEEKRNAGVYESRSLAEEDV